MIDITQSLAIFILSCAIIVLVYVAWRRDRAQCRLNARMLELILAHSVMHSALVRDIDSEDWRESLAAAVRTDRPH